MSGEVWTDQENDAIVADYFAMLADDLAGRTYSKADHNRALQARLARPRGSIEYKHQNISAVLKAFGQTWLLGYKPAVNFQTSLIDAVWRWMSRNADLLSRMTTDRVASPGRVSFESPLWIGPPPSHSNAPPPTELEQMTAIAKQFDVAELVSRNRALGRAGEERVLAHEKMTLIAAGRNDLAAGVRWIAEEEGDGAGYDIASFEPDGRSRLIEVKTTIGWERTPFFISRNELAVANMRKEEWVLFRLWDFAREPRAFEIRPPLEAHVALTPMSFQAAIL